MCALALNEEEGQRRRLVATVSAELIKPIGEDTWDGVGARLRDLRDASHRLLNAGVTACAIANASGKGDGKALGAAARSAVKEQLEREREDARRALEKEVKKKGDGRAALRATLERRAMLSLPSVVEDCTARKAYQAYSDYRKHAWRGDKSLPSFKGGAPIFFRDGDQAWEIAKDGRNYTLGLKLLAGRTGKVVFALGASGGSAFAHLRRMVEQPDDLEVKLGDCKILHVPRKKKWFVRMSYSWNAPERPELDPHRMIAVHRGIRSFLTWACEGDVGILASGGDVLAKKAQFTARRSGYRAHKRELGHGAKGHGLPRRYATYHALDEAENNFIKTKCQQVGAAIVKLAQARSCGTVVIEDYSARELGDSAEGEHLQRLIRQWPFARLKEAIAWACKREGLSMREVPAQYESVTCPDCHHVDAKSDKGTGLFECTKCGLKRNVDAVAAWNMLNAAGSPDGFKKNEEKIVKPMVRAIKGKRGRDGRRNGRGAAEE
jgi:IS605 OrfB family transposase